MAYKKKKPTQLLFTGGVLARLTATNGSFRPLLALVVTRVDGGPVSEEKLKHDWNTRMYMGTFRVQKAGPV